MTSCDLIWGICFIYGLDSINGNEYQMIIIANCST